MWLCIGDETYETCANLEECTRFAASRPRRGPLESEPPLAKFYSEVDEKIEELLSETVKPSPGKIG